MHKICWVAAFGSAAVMIVSIELFLPKLQPELPVIIDFISRIERYYQVLAAVVVLYCYYRLMKVAARAKGTAKV